MWLHSLKVAQLLRSAACLHTNQSRSYLNHLVHVQKTKCLFMPFDRLQCQSNKFFKMWQVQTFWNDINKCTLRKCREYESIKFVEHLATIPSRSFCLFGCSVITQRLKCTDSKFSLFYVRVKNFLFIEGGKFIAIGP